MNTKRGLAYGIGVNDYVGRVKENGKHIKAYRAWISMLSRCYGKKELVHRPSYIGCSVCDEWLLFSNFKRWYDENYIDGFQLDKDLLVKGNKVYSPETCCFVPIEINCFLLESNLSRGESGEKGVYKTKNNTYIAGYSENGKRVYLGSFKTLELAKKAYALSKEKRAKTLANLYFEKGLIKENVYLSLLNYKAY